MRSLFIVDDEEWVRKLLKRLVPWKDLDLVLAGEASGGSQALALCAATRPSIVLTDIRMPGLDGIALMRGLKETSPSSLIVVISGFGDFDYAREALRYGAAAYLLKPVDEDELHDVLVATLERIEKAETVRRNRKSAYAELRRLRSAAARINQDAPGADRPLPALLSDRAAAIIASDLSVQRTLESVAEELGVTARHLSKVFKNEKSVGFSEFSTAIRVGKARELLLVPSLRISDVAALLGYADSHYFSRVFKLRIGASPESFRSRPTGL